MTFGYFLQNCLFAAPIQNLLKCLCWDPEGLIKWQITTVCYWAYKHQSPDCNDHFLLSFNTTWTSAPFSHLTGDLRMLGETFLWRVILQTHTVCRVSEINTHPRTHICWITLGVSSHKHKSGNHLRNYSSSVQRAARQAGVDNTAAAYRLLPPLLLTPPTLSETPSSPLLPLLFLCFYSDSSHAQHVRCVLNCRYQRASLEEKDYVEKIWLQTEGSLCEARLRPQQPETEKS